MCKHLNCEFSITVQKKIENFFNFQYTLHNFISKQNSLPDIY